MSSEPQQHVEQRTSLSAAFSRIFWMMLGPMILVVVALNIAQSAAGWLTGADMIFLIVLAGMIAARWFEFHKGDPQTATGAPATPAHLRRYVLSAALLGVGVWVIVNLVGNHWWNN
ncbi:MAG: hypothetical protein AB7K24_15585 [Gemmataceae bacterium]